MKPSGSGNPTADAYLASESLERAAAQRRQPLLHHDDHEHHAPAPNRSPGRVSRTLVNFWLDTALGVFFVLLCVTATIVQFVFPPGVAARGVSFMRLLRWRLPAPASGKGLC